MTEPSTERIVDPEPQYWPFWVFLSGVLVGIEKWLRSLGGPGLRYGIRAFWAVVAFGGIVLLVGPIINKPLTLDDISAAAKDITNNWIAKDFSAHYDFSKADDGTLTAQVEERVTAVFPEGLSEKEIKRVLPRQYRDHALNPGNFTASMDGKPIQISESRSPNYVTLGFGDGTALTGSHDFVFTYTIDHLAYPDSEKRLGTPIDALSWDVFGASWTQGVKGVDVSFTLTKELNDRLLYAPVGGINYVFLGASESLTPEPGTTAGDVTYGFTAEQGLPPHSNAWFTLAFDSGTITMPGFNLFYWVKVFGPALPLAFLVMTLLFAFAARAVAWSDERGKPWFVAQSQPPKNITPAMAAQILESKGSQELAVALKAAQSARDARSASRPKLLAAARVARRTGRIGDVPFALSTYLSAPERREQLSQKLRRVPRGFVRDFFLWSPIALTLVQWGLVRQLSHQYTSSILWWPFTFVMVSTLLSALVVWIAYSQRPLTVKGALVKQHLLGVDAFASQTLLLDRGPSTDPALPYAVLFGRPRSAGKRVEKLIQSEMSDRKVSIGWLTSSFLTWTRLSVRLLGVLLVVGSFVAVNVLPEYSTYAKPESYGLGPVNSSDPWSEVKSLDAHAILSRTTDGYAQLDVTEDVNVYFTHEGSRVSQFAQQWPTRVDGQDLDVSVSLFTIGGKEVPYVTERDGDTVLLRTTLVEGLEGNYPVRIEYVVKSAAVAAYAEGQLVDRVRWAALLDGWQTSNAWGYRSGLDTVKLTISMDAELAQESTVGGWMTLATKSAERVADWRETVIRFEDVEHVGKTVTHELTIRHDDNGGWPLFSLFTDLGPALDFPAGTFKGTNVYAFTLKRVLDVLPFWVGMSLAGLALLLSLVGIFAGLRRRGRIFEPGVFRDLVWWLLPGVTVAAVFAMGWMTLSVAAAHPIVAPLLLGSLAAVTGTITALILTKKGRALSASQREMLDSAADA